MIFLDIVDALPKRADTISSFSDSKTSSLFDFKRAFLLDSKNKKYNDDCCSHRETICSTQRKENAMSDPRRNEEGYLDLTAYHGTKSIIQEENEAERKNKDLIHTFRLLADMAGFEIVGRITIKHKKTGRVFR